METCSTRLTIAALDPTDSSAVQAIPYPRRSTFLDIATYRLPTQDARFRLRAPSSR